MTEIFRKRTLMKSLAGRAVAYAGYASLAWVIALLVGAKTAPDSLSVEDMAFCAAICVFGGVSSFALIAFCRRAGFWGAPEYALALLGRTGIPCVLVLYCLIRMDDECFRAATLRILIVYFLTAPLHVWLTIPSEAEFHKGYVESIDKRRA